MSFETVDYELRSGVAVVRMNRPEALNALSLQLSRDLKAAIEKTISDNARAVILTGNGRAFCSGGDLREMQSIGREQGRIEAFLDEPLKALHDVIRLIRETPMPFIAAVNGVCAGAGGLRGGLRPSKGGHTRPLSSRLRSLTAQGTGRRRQS